MYIRTNEGLGQTKLPSIHGTPCWQDALPGNGKFIDESLMTGMNWSLSKFDIRSAKLTTKHKKSIMNEFVPAIVKSWQTTKPLRTIILLGHTDAIGDQLFNYYLGLKRAKVVREEITKVIKAKNPDLLDKIKIEVFSGGECLSAGSHKRDRRNRMVSIYAIDTTL